MGKKIGVVVPAYNEEDLLQRTVEGIPEFVDRTYIIDDGSTDATPQIIKALSRSRSLIYSLRHEQRRGPGAALASGYKKALEEGMDIVVVMAGDDQMDPAQLPNLLAPIIDENVDYAKGNRMSMRKHLQGMTSWRRLGNWLLRWLTRIASGNYKIMDPQNGYTAITKKALKQINVDSIYPYYGCPNDILVKLSVAGARICEVPMPARYQGEKSKIKYSKYIPKVSMLLLSDFLWRLWVKYIKRPLIRNLGREENV